jgi:hypothetical protein
MDLGTGRRPNAFGNSQTVRRRQPATGKERFRGSGLSGTATTNLDHAALLDHYPGKYATKKTQRCSRTSLGMGHTERNDAARGAKQGKLRANGRGLRRRCACSRLPLHFSVGTDRGGRQFNVTNGTAGQDRQLQRFRQHYRRFISAARQLTGERTSEKGQERMLKWVLAPLTVVLLPVFVGE